MPTSEAIRIGSSKLMRSTDNVGEIEMVDRGLTSVFDRGPIPDFDSHEIAVARTTQADAIFRFLAHHGVPTHYIARTGENVLRVRECKVAESPLLSGRAHARMLGLEVLCRLRATQKFCERHARGEIPADKLSLYPGEVLRPDTKFMLPFVEFSTKWRPGGDIYLTDAEAARLTGSDARSIDSLLNLGFRIACLLEKFTSDTGYQLYDFKCEVAVDFETREFIIIDGITVDEMGMKRGAFLYGKNPIRFFYQQQHHDWVLQLKEAQAIAPEGKLFWPEYPPLPEYLIKEQVTRYQEVADSWSAFVAERYS